MSQDIVADALNMIKNAKRARKDVIKINVISNMLIEILKIMKQKESIKKYKIDSKNNEWEMRRNYLSKRYTTKWNEILNVKI